MSKFNKNSHTDRTNETDGAEFDAQVDVMKSHNQLDSSQVHTAKATAREQLNRAIAEESRRPAARGRRPLMWVGGVAAAAAAATLVAMNVSPPNDVEVRPAQPTATSTPTPQPTTPAPTSQATKTNPSPPTSPSSATASSQPSTEASAKKPGVPTGDLVDPFSLASIEQEITFRYAADLVDGSTCKPEYKKYFATVNSMRNLKRTPVTVRAMRAQTRFFWLGDTTREDLQHIHTAILSLPKEDVPWGSHPPFQPWGTYFDASPHWGVDCDGKAYRQLFGADSDNDEAARPPMPRQGSGTLDKLIAAVMSSTEVKTAAIGFNKCYSAASQQEIDSDWIVPEAFIKYSGAAPKPHDPEQIWTCYEASGLQAASRKVQAQWQAANPDVVKKWKADPAFYASKVAAAEKMIAQEEAKAGK